MARRRRSFFFDNINSRLLTNTTKNTEESKDDVDSGTTRDNDIVTLNKVKETINAKSVLYDTSSQNLNSTQKSNAKTNLGLATVATSGSYNDLTNVPSGLATTTYVDTEVAAIVDSAPATLNTLDELASALGDDANFATSTSTSLGNRLRIDVNNQSLTGAQKTNALTNLGITSTVAELNYVDGVTSNIQTQLDAKGTSSFSGAYADLTGKPSSFSGAYADLTGKPSLFSGAYADLSGKPTIPTNNNQLTNGANYITGITSIMVTTALGFTPGTSSFSGAYADLSGKPTIPTNNNQLTNGAGYTTFTANQGLNTTSDPTFTNVYVNDWFRNNAAGEGLYNQATGQHFYSAGSNYWHINSNNGLIFYSGYNSAQGNATNRKGYVYFDSSGFGLLHSGGGWAVRTDTATIELYNNVKINSISEAPGEWNPALLEDGGIIKKDSSVSIHGDGYLKASYLNMSHGVGSRTNDTVFYSSYDDYIRKNNKAGMQSSLGIGAGAVYLDVSGANYGTVKVDDDRGVTWAGYTIRDDWSLMSNGENVFGVYNDTDNEWMLYINRNGTTDLLYNGSTRIQSTSGGMLVSGTIDCTSQFAYTARNYGHGVFGVYSAVRYQHVWSMGTAYKTSADGTSYGNMYGLTYTHTNIGTGTNQAISGLSHQLQHRTNGTLTAAIGTGIWTSGNLTAYSDIAVKENIVKIDNAIDKVKQISGYTYDRIDIKKQNEELGEDIPTRQAGVIAQEIEKVLPEVVSGEDGNKSVAYGNVVALLIEAIKEQQLQIEELKERLQ